MPHNAPQYAYKIDLNPLVPAASLEAFLRDLAAHGVPLPAGILQCLQQLAPGQSVLTPAYSVRRIDGTADA